VSVVRINAITVPPDRREEFERRFANRAGEVSKSPGFEAFELLRPTDGRDVFLVYTRWRSEDDFTAWVNSAAFQHGHKAHSQGGPVGTASELWSFEVIQQEGAPQAEATAGGGAG
jgi:heme oxygenase (mycobilin-producing)